jgi:RNA polymerase sigma factor (sigma-70 family)
LWMSTGDGMKDQRLRAYLDFVYAAAVRQRGKGASAGEVEDVVQAVFLVMSRKGRSRGGGGLPEERFMWGWLVRVTQYAVQEARRTERRRGFHERRAGEVRGMESGGNEEERRAVEAALDEALLALGRVDREVVVRRYLRGEAVREVAAAVGMEENTAGRRIARALEKLRKALQRRGVTAPVGLVMAVLASEMVVKAPAAMAAGVGSAGTAAASGVAKGVFWRLSVAKISAAAIAAAVVVVVGAGAIVGMRAMASSPVVHAATAPVAMVVPTAADVPATQTVAETQPLEKAWGDLAGLEPGASRGMLALAGKPEEAVAFFKERLLPLTISEAEVRALIGKLGSDEESVWRPAFERLEYFDPRLAIGLTALMDEVQEDPTRRRLVAVLSDRKVEQVEEGAPIVVRKVGKDGYNFVAHLATGGTMAWWAEDQVARLTDEWEITKKKWTQADRAIVLLGAIGTPDAMAIVRGMATGNADAEPTKLAKETLAEVAAAATRPAAGEAALEVWWADMTKPGPPAWRALLAFAARPSEAVAFFKTRLVPLTISEEEVRTLVESLGSDNEAEWKGAAAKMAYFDPRLAVDIKTLMQEALDPMQNSRLAEVLMDQQPGTFAGLHFKFQRYAKDNYGMTETTRGASYGVAWKVSQVDAYNGSAGKQQWRRAARAEVVLGAIGTAGATEILQSMATGNAEAEPTRVAKEELARLGK